MKKFITVLFIFLFAFLTFEVGDAGAYGRNKTFRSNARHNIHDSDNYGRNIKFRTSRTHNSNRNHDSYGINVRY